MNIQLIKLMTVEQMTYTTKASFHIYLCQIVTNLTQLPLTNQRGDSPTESCANQNSLLLHSYLAQSDSLNIQYLI